MLHHVFTFLAHDVFFVLFWVIHDKGRYIDLYMFLVSHCFDLYLLVIHDMSLFCVM